MKYKGKCCDNSFKKIDALKGGATFKYRNSYYIRSDVSNGTLIWQAVRLVDGYAERFVDEDLLLVNLEFCEVEEA